MNRSHRVVALTLVAASMLVACRKKPEPAPAPAPAPPPRETCDQRCRDSIANQQRIADSIARARAAAEEAERARVAAVAAARASLTAKIFFDYDQADIRGDARGVLDAKIPVLRANPAVRLRVAGHADERGSDEYNLALSQRRAAMTKKYLTDNGIDPARIEIVGYGEERPAVQGGDETAFAQNRRAEFEVIAGGENIQPPRS